MGVAPSTGGGEEKAFIADALADGFEGGLLVGQEAALNGDPARLEAGQPTALIPPACFPGDVPDAAVRAATVGVCVAEPPSAAHVVGDLIDGGFPPHAIIKAVEGVVAFEEGPPSDTHVIPTPSGDVAHVAPNFAAWRSALANLLRPSEVEDIALVADTAARSLQQRFRSNQDRRRIALALCTLRLRYIPEDPNGPDIWQSPRCTWNTKGGDCEDLAIFIASIALVLGMRITFVLGTLNGIGHAWLRVFDFNGGEWGIEPTSRLIDQWPASLRRSNGLSPDPQGYKVIAEYPFTNSPYTSRFNHNRV